MEGLHITAIRRRLVHQKLGKIVTEPLLKGDEREIRWLYRYRREAFYIQFPSELRVDDLVGVEMDFQRVGDEIKIKPKSKTSR